MKILSLVVVSFSGVLYGNTNKSSNHMLNIAKHCGKQCSVGARVATRGNLVPVERLVMFEQNIASMKLKPHRLGFIGTRLLGPSEPRSP